MHNKIKRCNNRDALLPEYKGIEVGLILIAAVSYTEPNEHPFVCIIWQHGRSMLRIDNQTEALSRIWIAHLNATYPDRWKRTSPASIIIALDFSLLGSSPWLQIQVDFSTCENTVQLRVYMNKNVLYSIEQIVGKQGIFK